jgi:5-methylcytosine-specific restriction protein A
MPSRVPTHRPARIDPTSRHREYDRRARDPEATRFYRSAAWLRIRSVKLGQDPLCQRCRADGRLVPATVVHHRTERREDEALALDLDNLESLCASCHGRHHASAPGGGVAS